MEQPRWRFPSNNKGDIKGIADSGVETFQGTPLKSLAREICQNSLDAAINDKPVELEFKTFVLEPDDFPDAFNLRKAFIAAKDFWSNQSRPKEFFDKAIRVMDYGAIPFMRISDFNTTGLWGSRGEYNTAWCNLTKSSGTSDKLVTSGGSFGIGKFAPFACSDFRTVFYSTIDNYNVSAFQGVSRITSFRDSDGEITAGTGYYGAESNMPLYEQLNLDPSFSRQNHQTGTDIFVAGFRYFSVDWKREIISSVLDGFLYAIFNGRLIVRVENVAINKDTLPTLIEEYQYSIAENADKYYEVLTSGDTTWKDTDFKGLGKIRLGLIIKSGMHRRVAMIRKTGMKIMDRGHISSVIPFAGVMIIEGEKINDLLRRMENPQHTKWEPERAINPSEAKTLLKELLYFIKDCLEEIKNDDSQEAIDPSVGEYLPDEVECSNDESHESEGLQDHIKTIDATIISAKPPRNYHSKKHQNGKSTDRSSDEKNHSNRSITNSSSGANPNARNEHTQIDLLKVRTICLDKDQGKYSMIVVPAESADNACLELFLSGESEVYEAEITRVSSNQLPSLHVSSNRICGLAFSSNIPIRLLFSIKYSDYCSMEVKAYGYTK